jgi:hypothetical protein
LSSSLLFSSFLLPFHLKSFIEFLFIFFIFFSFGVISFCLYSPFPFFINVYRVYKERCDDRVPTVEMQPWPIPRYCGCRHNRVSECEINVSAEWCFQLPVTDVSSGHMYTFWEQDAQQTYSGLILFLLPIIWIDYRLTSWEPGYISQTIGITSWRDVSKRAPRSTNSHIQFILGVLPPGLKRQ